MTKQYAFHFNSNMCTGCKACQIACKDKWDLPVGVTWRRVAEYSTGNWTTNPDGSHTQNVSAYYVSIACNHCQNPLCVEVCPTTAMHKREDGIVEIDTSACIGCRYCEWACPYGAPQFNAALGVMTKCTFCSDALDAGGSPSCVAACPSRALDFGELEELKAKYGDVQELAPLPSADLTSPSLIISPHRDAAPVGAGAVANPEEV
ncbi:MAG: dimethylsulfoxide reductase subunit B [Anaerolineae bacterium]|nr:dimethylsulfoxide reductase subunit B [Anaerolineae bacterium]